jgi:hypothetical protein
MAHVLSFPSPLLAQKPAERTRASPSAEEDGNIHSQRGLRIVPEGGFGRPKSTLDFSNVIGVVLAQIDGEIATQAGRERVGRLFAGSNRLFPGSAA